MSSYDLLLHHRRSIRLKGFDYSLSGLYFITICVHHRVNLLGGIVPEKRAPTRGAPTNGIGETGYKMQLNEAGEMIEMKWLAMEERFQNIRLHEFVVMPNHFHGIIEIVGAPLVGAHTNHDPILASIETLQSGKGQPQGIAPTNNQLPSTNSIGDIIGAFKSISTNAYIKGVKTRNWQPFNGKLWQRNYWEHIIRDEKDYHVISEYIRNNPSSWPIDTLNPACIIKQKSLPGS